MKIERSAGVLAHVTCLPGGGGGGIGDLGPQAVRFLDWAVEGGFRLWQVLPLGPTGPGGSPYDSASSFAGNPWLVSSERLVQSGLLPASASVPMPAADHPRVEFEPVAAAKWRMLRASWEWFRRSDPAGVKQELSAFVEHPHQSCWLEDWVLYAALKERYGGAAWFDWDEEIRLRRPAALRRAARELAQRTAFHRYVQFLFFRQWSGLRRAAHRRGIRLFGDLPYYAAHDSADVWANRELFHVERDGRATKIGGVPPDYFSETGQLWGNPVYRWDRLAERGFAWWIDRLRANLSLVDLLRLDHFRGFAGYWEVDGEAETAIGGHWVDGPGRRLFDALRDALGDVDLVAEDLGVITPDVVELREELGLPGMYVMQFALGGDASDWPPDHRQHAVVYTGTHDNDTLCGWFAGLDPPLRQRVLDSLGAQPETVCPRVIEETYRSPARLAVIPLQDLLELGAEARLNRPGAVGGNWSWRVPARLLTLERAARYRALARTHGR